MPVVDDVDLSAYTGVEGDAIVVRAHDDFQVTRLHLYVSNANGKTIESGDALETTANSGLWVYTATTAVPEGTNVGIAVTVSDRLGGMGEATAEKQL